MSTTLGQAKEQLCRVVANGVAPADPRVVTRINEATNRLFTLTDFVGKHVRYGFDAQWGCVTLPRHLETVLGANVNGAHFHIRNGWFEHLEGGPGVLSPNSCTIHGLVDRGDGHPTFHDICGAHKVKVYADVPELADAKILIKGFDENNNEVMTQLDGNGPWIMGEYVQIDNAGPRISTKTFSRITQIVKPKTNGYVRLYQYDGPTIVPPFLSITSATGLPPVSNAVVTVGNPTMQFDLAYSIYVVFNTETARYDITLNLWTDVTMSADPDWTSDFFADQKPDKLHFVIDDLNLMTASFDVDTPAGSGTYGESSQTGILHVWYQPAHDGTLGSDRTLLSQTNTPNFPGDPIPGVGVPSEPAMVPPLFTGTWSGVNASFNWYMRAAAYFEITEESTVTRVLISLYEDEAHFLSSTPFYTATIDPNPTLTYAIGYLNGVTDSSGHTLTWAFTLNSWRNPDWEPGQPEAILKIHRTYTASVSGVPTQSAIAIIHPDEEVPSLRRYLIPGIDGSESSKVSLLCQRRWLPVSRDSDLVYPGNLGALKHMLLAIEKEEKNKLQEAQAHEVTARRILRDELKQYLGPHSQPMNMQITGHFQPLPTMM